GPEAITRPTPRAMAASRIVRGSTVFCIVQKLVSVSRIALVPIQISTRSAGRPSGIVPRLQATYRRRFRIGRDQGAFAAGTPRNESYNRAATPATMATSAKLNTYQLKV